MAEAQEDTVAKDGTVSIEWFANLYKLNPERIRQLIKEGFIERGPRGRVHFLKGVQSMDRFRQDQLRRATERAGGTDSKVKDARAREIEMRIAQRSGALIDYTEALAICQTLFGMLKSELDGLAASVSREREMRHRVQDRIDGALNRVAKRIEKWQTTGRLQVD